MNADQIEPILQAWMDKQRAVEAKLDTIYAVLGADPGSQLLEAIYWLMDAHTKAVEQIIGDDEGWLTWFAIETDWGRSNAHHAQIQNKAVRVRTIKQLARVVAAR